MLKREKNCELKRCKKNVTVLDLKVDLKDLKVDLSQNVPGNVHGMGLKILIKLHDDK